jgi:peptidoglycan hydrolase-like protein with peptidoglycan-binding domain
MSSSTTQIQPWPHVRRGDSEHPVRTLQHLLRAHGSDIAADGAFGPRTDASLRDFQGARGLAADGVAGPLTWPVLIVEVRKGDHGEAVRGVQVEFRFRDLSGIPGHGLALDGSFGPATDAAVRGFQEALAVTVDGIVGPVTWRALVSGMLAG